MGNEEEDTNVIKTIRLSREKSSSEDEEDRSNDIILNRKIVLLGDSETGKTSLLIRFDQNRYAGADISSTVGVGYAALKKYQLIYRKLSKLPLIAYTTHVGFITTENEQNLGPPTAYDMNNKVVSVEGEKLKLQIWDTAGQERFRSITRSYYRGAEGMILVYDVTKRESFEHIRDWMSEIGEHTDQPVAVVIIGNKCDLSTKREISASEAESLAQSYSVQLFETSARTGDNVDEAFMALAKLVALTSNPQTPVTSPTQEFTSDKTKCSCLS